MDTKDANYCYYIVGKNIKKFRKLRGLTQEQLAVKCNLTTGFISDLESNTYRSISLPTMYLIGQQLGIHPKRLLHDLDTKDE